MSENLLNTDWIAVDWGTTHLRAWAISKSGDVLARSASDQGMSVLSSSEFEDALLDVIGDWLAPGSVLPVICCGMVGSRQGWVEAPYNAAPCAPIEDSFIVEAPTRHSGIIVYVFPGVKQMDPADVMRGEETQIAGFLAEQPGFEGVICLPGTHTKWVDVKAGCIVRFTTFLTGELFSLLANKSVLRHSVSADGWDDVAFKKGVSEALSAPESFADNLFSLRAQSLVSDLEPHIARSTLSGLIIGMELCATKKYWQNKHATVVGSNDLVKIFVEALHSVGGNATSYNGETMTLSGLSRAFGQMRKQKIA